MPKPPKTNSILYVKLASLDDLSRFACNFDYTSSNIVSVKGKNGYSLMVFGEQIEGTTLAYYLNMPDRESMICYTYPSSSSQSENSHFVKEIGTHPNHYMNILEMEGKNLKKAAKVKAISLVMVHSHEALITAVIKKGVSHESLAHIYSFSKNGKTVFCAFDIIDELSEGPRTLYYSISDRKPNAGFARYKYTENKVDFATYMGEHSYMYAKIINLAEPFPFFKMPN